jgi:hypothetical protein
VHGSYRRASRAGMPSNLYDWWHFLSMDITCDLSFGLTFNMLQEGAKNQYVKDLYGSLTIEPVRWHFGWLNRFAAWETISVLIKSNNDYFFFYF